MTGDCVDIRLKNKENILLVDDDAAFLKVAQAILKSKGYCVEAAHNGEEALQRISGSSFSLVILDIMLPDMSGIELLTAINRMQPNSSEIVFDDISVGKAFAFGIQRLQKRQDRRKVMVLVTTTVDRDSYRNMQEYQEVLRGADIEFYVVSFAPRFPPPISTFEEKMNPLYFRNLVGETAGKLYLSGEYAFVSEFMDDLRTRLENTYTIGFYVESQKEPTEHEVRIEVRDPKVEVTHRKKVVY